MCIISMTTLLLQSAKKKKKKKKSTASISMQNQNHADKKRKSTTPANCITLQLINIQLLQAITELLDMQKHICPIPLHGRMLETPTPILGIHPRHR